MDLLERVRATGLLPEGGRVVVLLSGGRDSVCLLDVAARIGSAATTLALHVNYGLRDDADSDEGSCRSLCARLGVALEVKRAVVPGDAGNLQAWARDVRYGAGARLAMRDEALLAHATQIDPNGDFFRAPIEWQQRLWPTEEYELARSRVPVTLPETDLFTGVSL